MRWIRQLRLRVGSLLRSTQVERELNDEFQYHLEHLVDDYVSAGMSPQDARYKARRELGAIEQRKEKCRDVRGLALVDTLRQDITYAARSLRTAVDFTAPALLTLAVDSRPWWQVMHKFESLWPLSTVTPLGNVTLATV